MIADLSVEMAIPATGNNHAASRTGPGFGERITLYFESAALDECLSTARTKRVLGISNLTRHVPGIDEAKTIVATDYDRTF